METAFSFRTTLAASGLHNDSMAELPQDVFFFFLLPISFLSCSVLPGWRARSARPATRRSSLWGRAERCFCFSGWQKKIWLKSCKNHWRDRQRDQKTQTGRRRHRRERQRWRQRQMDRDRDRQTVRLVERNRLMREKDSRKEPWTEIAREKRGWKTIRGQ